MCRSVPMETPLQVEVGITPSGCGMWYTGADIRTLTGGYRVTSASFSPDGNKIATGSRDNTVQLWDVDTGAEIRILTGHTGWVNSVSFSPDGNTIASGSRDNTVRLWDVDTGAVIHALRHTDDVNSVSFSPNGNTIASGSRDTVRLWDVLSRLPLAMVFPSGLNDTLLTQPVCPVRMRISAPVSTSHSWTVLSRLPVAILFPSGLNEALVTLYPPVRVRMSAPVYHIPQPEGVIPTSTCNGVSIGTERHTIAIANVIAYACPRGDIPQLDSRRDSHLRFCFHQD